MPNWIPHTLPAVPFMLTAVARGVATAVAPVSESTAARFLSFSLAVPSRILDPTDDNYVVSTAVSILREQRNRIRWRTLRALFSPVGGFTPSQSYAIILRLRNTPHLAHRFFLWDLTRHDLRSHAAAAHVLARSRHRLAALSVIKSAVRSHESKPLDVFTSLAHHYHDVGSAPFVFDLLVLAYLDARKLDRAVEIARLLLSRGINPLVSTSNSLIRSTANTRGSEAALDLYRELFSSPASRVPANVHTFNAILLSLHRDGDLHTASEIRRNMSCQCQPNAFTYSISMAALCEKGLIEEARNLWEEMRAKGIEPDIVSFNTLIGGYCAAGRVREAEELYQQMTLTSMPPSCSTLQYLIQGHSKAGDLDSAMLVYRDMKRRDLNPDTDTLDVLLHEICEKRNATQGLKILREEMRRREFSVSRRSYEALICGWFCREGQMEKAVKLQAEMAGKGFDAGADVYSAFIEGYSSQGDAEQAQRLRDEMRRLCSNEIQQEEI